MKKIIYSIFVLVGLMMTSCEKEEIGGTATEALSGEWYVTTSWINDNNEVVYDDPYGVGHFKLNTYNTSENTNNKMWVDDIGNFWNFKVKVNCDINTLSFNSDGEAENVYYESGVTILNGKILPGAATTPHGTPADSIVFDVIFSDDAYMEYYGYTKFRFSGYRYTGLTADE